MNKVKEYLIGLARAWPIIVILIPFFSYFLTNNIDLLMLSVTLILLDKVFSPFMKHIVFKNLMGAKKYPIIGIGERPKGAKDCGLFLTKKDIPARSYGMPSGHSQSALFFSVYTIHEIINSSMNQSIKIIGILLLISIGLGIMYSRIYLKCHTIQQVIIGALLGSVLGTLYYNNKNFIKQQFNI